MTAWQLFSRLREGSRDQVSSDGQITQLGRSSRGRPVDGIGIRALYVCPTIHLLPGKLNT